MKGGKSNWKAKAMMAKPSTIRIVTRIVVKKFSTMDEMMQER
jgi:hypothetical protein